MFKTLSLSLLFVILSTIAQAQTKPAAKPKPTQAKTTTGTKPSVAKSSAAAKPKPGVKPVAGKVTFKITGKLTGFKNHLIVLNRFRSTEYTLIDSVTTDAEGNFSIQKTIAEPCIAYLQHSKNTAVPLIIENGAVLNVVINITAETNAMDYSITGVHSEKSVRLYNFIKMHSTLYSELGVLEQQIYSEQDPMKMQEYQFQYDNKQKQMRANIQAELLNSSGLEGYFVFYNFIEEQKAADVKKIMDKMSPTELKTIYYKDLKEYYDNNKLLDIGAMAPEIYLPTPNGDSLKLSDLRGKVVLIDFWASWCRPCINEFPNVKRVYSRFSEKGFEILGVSLDKEESAWKNSIISLGLGWKHVSDLKYWGSAPAKMYKISSIPSTILIDKDGKIIAKNLRGEELERKLEELFQ
ncbi:MAG: TlpA disulfide reductase family protein [Bacteroidota bacterium]